MSEDGSFLSFNVRLVEFSLSNIVLKGLFL